MSHYYDYAPRLELARPAVLTGYISDFSRAVAYRASALLGLTYRDVDRLVEHEAGMDLARFVVEFGEPSYRALESGCLERSLRQRPAGLIALGDGGLMNAGNLSLVRAEALVIVLDFDLPNVLWRAQRLARQADPRPWHPLYRSLPGSVAEIRPFYQERRVGFDHADVVIAANSLSVPEVCDEVMKHLAATSSRASGRI